MERLKLLKIIAKTIKNSLPHAFDSRYWDMANTTYREEIALAYIEDLKMKPDEAKSFLRMCGLTKGKFPVLYYQLDGHIKSSMGAHYNVTVIGDKFLNNFIINKHL